MSDDDFEEPEVDAEVEVEPEPDVELDDEVEPAGSDEGDESDDDNASIVTETAARPERQKADPIIQGSNKPRFVQIVRPEDRITDNRLHKSEASLIISMRAQQIAKYATSFVDSVEHDPVARAYAELYARRCPLLLRRQVGITPEGNPVVEEWCVREMVLPPLVKP